MCAAAISSRQQVSHIGSYKVCPQWGNNLSEHVIEWHSISPIKQMLAENLSFFHAYWKVYDKLRMGSQAL